MPFLPRDPEAWIAERIRQVDDLRARMKRLDAARQCLLERDREYDQLRDAITSAAALVPAILESIRDVSYALKHTTPLPPWGTGDRREWEAAEEDRIRAEYYNPRKGPFDPK